jgi:hypothetical protein
VIVALSLGVTGMALLPVLGAVLVLLLLGALIGALLKLLLLLWWPPGLGFPPLRF